MSQTSATRNHRLYQTVPTVLTVGLILVAVLVPIGGLILAMLEPADLFETPARKWSDLAYLVGKTLSLAGLVAIASLTLGTWLAWAETRTEYFGRRWLALRIDLAPCCPKLSPRNHHSRSHGPRGSLGQWFGTDAVFSGFIPAAIVHRSSSLPDVQILVSAALNRLPASTDEAARLLGAGGWRRFWTLTAPALRPTWTFSLVIVTFYVISDFGAVAVLNCEVLTWALYQARHAPADAVRIGFGIILCVIPILLGLRILHGAASPSRPLVDARVLERVKLGGPILVLTYFVLTFIAGLGLVLPVITLSTWVYDGIQANLEFASIGSPLSTTFYTLVGATLTLLCALLPAWTFGRRQDKLSNLGEHATYASSSLPGILVPWDFSIWF